jgi:hypothetical protein
MPVGTLQYWLRRLMELGVLYSLRLAWRPRYFHAAVAREEAEVIYVIREVKLTPSRAAELTTGLRPEVVQLVADKYPLRQTGPGGDLHTSSTIFDMGREEELYMLPGALGRWRLC